MPGSVYLNSHAGVENSAVKMRYKTYCISLVLQLPGAPVFVLRYKKGDNFLKLDDVIDFLIGLVLFIAGATLGIFLFVFGLQNNII